MRTGAAAAASASRRYVKTTGSAAVGAVVVAASGVLADAGVAAVAATGDESEKTARGLCGLGLSRAAGLPRRGTFASGCSVKTSARVACGVRRRCPVGGGGGGCCTAAAAAAVAVVGVAVAGVAPGNAPHAPAGAAVVPAALGVGVGVPEAEGGVCTNGLAITGGCVCALRRDSGALVWGGS